MVTLRETLKKYKKDRFQDALKETKKLRKTLQARCRNLFENGAISEAYLFGSITKPEYFHKKSDIDIALSGEENIDYWRIEAKLEQDLTRSLDVEWLDDLSAEFSDQIRREGEKLCP